MKKNIINDKKTFMMFITYLIMFIIGLISMVFPKFGFIRPVLYSSVLFYIVAFFGIIGYFSSPGENKDYEMLFFSLINILVASYLFISDFSSVSLALGNGFLAFMVFETINKIYFTNKLKKTGTNLWLLRAISIILLIFLSVLTIQNFYRGISDVKSVMIGYYFLTFGLISAIELLLVSQVDEKTFELLLNGQFEEIAKNSKKKIKNVNENVEKLEKINSTIKKIKRKKLKVKKYK